MTRAEPLLTAVDVHLAASGAPDWDVLLGLLLEHYDCPLGTVHLRDPATGLLELRAQRGLPPPVLDKVRSIPIGKGMAGIAAERKQPVQVCNLQTDESGVVRPGAKLTQMEGSVAAPMLHGSEVVGVLGVAKPVAYEFTAEQTELLMTVGRRLADRLARR